MNKKVTIIMYHYVRDLKYSRFPEIKGLDINLFKEQVAYLKKNYNFITVEHLIDAINNRESLPSKSCLLTFDDAYIDHFTNVFPVLNRLGIQGAFFPPIKAVTQNRVLDVNKIHFILASTSDKDLIIAEILKQLNTFRKDRNLLSDNEYFVKLAVESRYDSAKVMFIKNMLQYELEEDLRSIIVDNLFAKFLKVDEESFSKELYMSEDQIRCMLQNGMHIGSHGLNHVWLGKTPKEKQKIELDESVKYLLKMGVNPDYLTLCYPYGSYNTDTIDLMPAYNFKIGFGTDVEIASIEKHSSYCLPRLDTNDLPKNSNAEQTDWFYKG